LARLTPYYMVPKLKKLTQIPPVSGGLGNGMNQAPKAFSITSWLKDWHEQNGITPQ
ncbi:MAG: hypothetical protein JJ975_17560, partial [Bacteroidia bacterium]|nr:hypothetical protein [Bacteroidia bacterium]